MKKMAFLLMAVVLLMGGCGAGGDERHDIEDDGYRMVCKVRTTAVRDQGDSELCWVYAMLSTIESERLAMGDSVCLSADYLARMLIADKGRRCQLSGKIPGMRGMAQTAVTMMMRYGMMPHGSYHAREGMSYRVLKRKVAVMARQRTTFRKFDTMLGDLLDREIGYLPRAVYMLGAEYTPVEFAHSVCLPDDWMAVTSFTHHPYGERFVLETPDNVLADSFLNVRLDTMMAWIERSLMQGHPVCWEGDISEPGFSMDKGTAVLEGMTPRIDSRMRQLAFERRETTDDHCMELIGIATDARGRKFFVAQNSWGIAGRYGGYILMSDSYMRLKTIAVMIKAGT